MQSCISFHTTVLPNKGIPTRLYLLRMIPRGKFQQQFPDLKYSKFLLSSIVRVLMGYFFLFRVFIVRVQSTMVIEIFYNALALQYLIPLPRSPHCTCSRWHLLSNLSSSGLRQLANITVLTNNLMILHSCSPRWMCLAKECNVLAHRSASKQRLIGKHLGLVRS